MVNYRRLGFTSTRAAKSTLAFLRQAVNQGQLGTRVNQAKRFARRTLKPDAGAQCRSLLAAIFLLIIMSASCFLDMPQSGAALAEESGKLAPAEATDKRILISDNLRPMILPASGSGSDGNAPGPSPAGSSTERNSDLQLLPPVRVRHGKGKSLMAPLPLKIETISLSGPVDLAKAVDIASQNYPKVLQARAVKEQYQAGVKLQKIKEYVPEMLMSWQEVFASRNKIDQILFMNEVMVQNPGTFNPAVSMTGRFYSGMGYLISWDPIDFGLHKARITGAKSEYKEASAELGVTRLDVAASAASAFLAVAVADAEVRVGEAIVERFRVYGGSVHALVDADLRPGSDASYADAQLAEARNTLIVAKQNYKTAMADLAMALGCAGEDIPVALGKLAENTYSPPPQAPTFKLYEHPLAILGRSTTYKEIARKNILDKSYYPQIFFLAGMNFRGGGLNTQARPSSNYGYGWAPVVPNYNVGVMINFEALDYFKINQEKQVQLKKIQAEREHYNLVLQQIQTSDTKARAQLEGAVQVAENMPLVLKSATDAETSARTRYDVGLGNIAEVAQAEQMLARAQVQMAIAKVGVWQALLAGAYARGDLGPFLGEVARYGRGAGQ